jgi:hypothetical protein
MIAQRVGNTSYEWDTGMLCGCENREMQFLGGVAESARL